MEDNTLKHTKAYITIYEIADVYYGGKSANKPFIHKLRQRLRELPAECKIMSVEADAEYQDKKVKEVYLREEIEYFFGNYVLKKELVNELKKLVSSDTVYSYYKRLAAKEIILGGNLDIFISKKYAIELREMIGIVLGKANWGWRAKTFQDYKNEGGFLSIDEVGEKLKCSYSSVHKLIKSKELLVVSQYRDRLLFDKQQVMKLQFEQKKLIEIYTFKYYTSKQIQEKYSAAFAQYIKGTEEKVRIKVTKIYPPTLLISYYGVQMRLYIKEEIDKLWKDYKLFKDINSMSIEDPYEDFIYKVEQVLNINFTTKQQNTKKLWYKYINKFFLKSRLSDKSRVIFQTNQFVRCTEEIFEIFDKEIYTYSASEINIKYLDEELDIKRSYQRYFYNFLKQMITTFSVKEMPLPFAIEDLNKPTSFKRIKEVSTDIYSIEEYHRLYEYVNNLEVHKYKAIKDVNDYINKQNNKNYKGYDSCWLYILVQLTNNWRHSTILTQIPRIDLSSTSIESLDWLQKNTPSIEDANNIVYQIGRYVTKISKTETNAEGIFIIGEPLKLAFATAVSICEFRRRATIDDSLTLIDLSGHLVKAYNPHREFFKEFDKGFKFENRKMNRTLSTLIWSVLRHMGKGLKETQVSRSHAKDETTIKHYIKLSDSQVNNLVNELFERKQFGYVTQSLTNIIFGIETDKRIETQRMLEVNTQFGNVLKIEATAGLINRITKERRQVEKYLNEFNLEGLRNLFHNLMTETLPSNQRDHQCLYANCIYETEFGERPSCTFCSASIINVYALENIMDNYIFMLEKILNEFDSVTTGEKQKLANHFYLLHSVVDQARQRFGREVVDGFVEGKTERIKKLGVNLSEMNLKGYRTTGILRGKSIGEK